MDLTTLKLPRLPVGAGGVLPTIWGTFVTTVLLALAFSFGNVWDLARRLGVERHIAPLIAPAVDLTVLGLVVGVPWLVMAGVSKHKLRPAALLLAMSGLITLVLNSGPSVITAWTSTNPDESGKAWGRAGLEAIVPFLLIAWSHVGPALATLFVEVRGAHQAKVRAIIRAAEQAAIEAEARDRSELRAAVEAARAEVAAEMTAAAEAQRVELMDAWRVERDALVASATAEVDRLRSSVDASKEERRRAEAEASRLRAELEARHAEPPRRPSGGGSKKPAERSTEVPSGSRRKTGAELLDERVERAKELLPTWQIETPTGPMIGSALDLRSEGTISDIRKRLESDRLAFRSQPAEQQQTSDERTAR